MQTLPLLSSRSWLVRYKLYHLPFWCLYHYLWWTVAVGNPVKAVHNIVFFPGSLRYGFYVLFEALAVYVNLYLLWPRFFEKGQYLRYGVLVAGTVLATALLIVAGYYSAAALSGKSLSTLFGDGSNCFFYFFGYALPSAAASMTLAMTIKFAKNRILEDRRREQIARNQTLTELNFLKQQFNPHFLFNSINGIFVLIRKNPDRASAALAKFSQLLRHQLYECNDPLVPLHKEIDYIRHFIELEQLRQNASVTVEVDIDPGDPGNLVIAPFILMTFVENAFKHAAPDPGGKVSIHIHIRLEHETLYLTVANTTAAPATGDTGGIGLQSVQRRLDLLYPLSHQWQTTCEDCWYQTTLRLHLGQVFAAAVPSTDRPASPAPQLNIV